jgi:AcrR family transcriptional regulator
MKRLGVKERIIESASHLFYTNGYNQTGINQIIAEANVAKASMYQHFRSKEDIAVAYLERRHQNWMGDLLDFISNKIAPKEKIIGCFDYLNHWLNEVDFRGCGFQNIITDLPTDQQKIKDQVRLHKNELRSWIHDTLNEEEQYANINTDALGDEILVLMDGAIILSQIQKNDWPINAAKNACERLLP